MLAPRTRPRDPGQARVWMLGDVRRSWGRRPTVQAKRGGEGLGSRILGINAVFHDPAAALVVDGRVVAAAEEERFSRRKHGKPPVAFSTWELPEAAARWCLQEGGIEPSELDAVAYSYDPSLAPAVDGNVTAENWEPLRTL